MNRICWWLVDLASRLLESSERDAVRGDLAESGESGGLALRGVLGLVVRRQAVLWSEWRSWVTLVGLIVPLGMLLSVVSGITASTGATYTWLYANNWEWALLRSRGFWYVFGDSAKFVLMRYLTLVCWSWTAGFVLGPVSRGMIRVNSVLFCLMLLFGELVGSPRYLTFFWQYVHSTFGVPRLPDTHGPVFTLMFYRVMFPLIVQAVLVAVPSLWGMRQGANAERLRPLLRTMVWTAAIATLTAMLVQAPGFGFLLKAYRHPEIWQSWPVRLLQFVVYWPIAYLVAKAIGRRWQRSRTVLA